jgi:membrane protein
MKHLLLQLRTLILEERPLRGWRRWLAVPGRRAWLFFRRAARNNVFVRAAAMGYMTLIALVPMLLLVFGTLNATGFLVGDPDAIRQLVFRSFLGDIQQVRDFLLPGLLQVDLAALGVVGIAGLVVVAARLYILAEKTYSDIFSVPVRRPWYLRLLMFYVALTLAPVLIVATVMQASHLVGGIGLPFAPGLSASLLQAIVLLAALKSFPATKVRWWPAIAGTLVSVLLLELALFGFRLYLRVFAAGDALQVIYGSLGVLPVFLLWLYWAWLTVLVGVEVAALMQDYDAVYARERAMVLGGEDDSTTIGSESALHVAAVIGSAFLKDEGPIGREAIAGRTGLSIREVGQVLAALELAGLVAPTEDGWLMTTDPSRLPLATVVDAWCKRNAPSTADLKTLARIRDELENLPEGTLAEAVERWGEESPSPGPPG